MPLYTIRGRILKQNPKKISAEQVEIEIGVIKKKWSDNKTNINPKIRKYFRDEKTVQFRERKLDCGKRNEGSIDWCQGFTVDFVWSSRTPVSYSNYRESRIYIGKSFFENFKV